METNEILHDHFWPTEMVIQYGPNFNIGWASIVTPATVLENKKRWMGWTLLVPTDGYFRERQQGAMSAVGSYSDSIKY